MTREIDLTIVRGKTFSEVMLYADDDKQYLPIAGMPSRAPVRLTVPGHGIPDGWPVTVASVKVPAELNTSEDAPYPAKVVDADTIEFNHLNGMDWRAYGGGGLVILRRPADLSGYQVRAEVRDKIGGALLFKWHSDPATNPDGLIELDGAKITLTIDAEKTAALAFKRGIYDAELVSPDGEVYQLVAPSRVTVEGEVTL